MGPSPQTSLETAECHDLEGRFSAASSAFGQLSEEVPCMRLAMELLGEERERLRDHLDGRLEALMQLLSDMDSKQAERMQRLELSQERFAASVLERLCEVQPGHSGAQSDRLGELHRPPNIASKSWCENDNDRNDNNSWTVKTLSKVSHASRAPMAAEEQENSGGSKETAHLGALLDTPMGGATSATGVSPSMMTDCAYDKPKGRQWLTTWTHTVGERFSVRVFLLELLGQSTWCFLGPSSLPVLYLLYGRSQAALSNRFMWPNSRTRKVVFYCDTLLSAMSALSLISYLFVIGSGEVGPSVVFAIYALNLLRMCTIAIKYASIPDSVYRHLNTAEWDEAELLDMLACMRWYRVHPEMADRCAEMSFLTVMGPTTRDMPLRFMSPESCLSAEAMSLQEGKMSRFIANRLLYHQGEAENSRQVLHEGISAKLSPRLAEYRQALQHQESLRGFFKKLTQAVLRMEENSKIAQLLFIPQRVLEALCIVLGLFPIIVCILDGRLPWETSVATQVHLVMCVLPTWYAVRANMYFLSTAVKDMWRRRTFMRCCVALLSSNLQDRENVPPEVRSLGILNLHDPETVEACRLLILMCRDWGAFFGRRCTVFFGMFTAVTGVIMVWTTVAIQAGLLNFITRELLYVVLFFCVPLAYTILTLVYLGEGGNRAAARVGAFLQKHCVALRGYATGARSLPPGSKEPDRLKVASKLLKSTSASVIAHAEKEPFTLMGMYCGYRLVTAMYIVPAFMVSTIATHCVVNPDMCKPELPW